MSIRVVEDPGEGREACDPEYGGTDGLHYRAPEADGVPVIVAISRGSGVPCP